MIEYNYKSFKVHYKIQADKSKKNLYIADGYTHCTFYEDRPGLRQQFHTEYTSKDGVTKEIKRLIENYIDFEWREFYEFHGKHRT